MRARTMIRTAAVIVLLALTIPRGSAQVSEQLSVELVEVPVYVRSAGGSPIQNLSRDAFELYVNGRREEIEYFDAINFGARATPSAPAAQRVRSSRERRLYLLLFDLHYSIPGHLARARTAARSVVAHSNPETDLFAVATYSTNKGVQFITAFTSDHIAIGRAIETLALSRQHDPLGLSISTAERADWAPMSDDGSGFTPGNRGDEADASIAEGITGGSANQEMKDEPEKRMTDAILKNFSDLAERMANLEGQKHVLYLSEGMKMFDVYDPRHPKFLDDMRRSFQQAGVFLDAVDIAGLRPMFNDSGKVQPSTNYNLELLADAGGGEFVHNRNDLSAAIGSVLQRQEALYVLAFHRRSTRGGTINVRLRGMPRGTHLSFREQFGDVGPKRPLDPLELADILVNSTPQHGATVVLSLETPSNPTLAIKVPNAEIAPQLSPTASFVDLLLYVFDAKGSVVLESQRRITIDPRLASEFLNGNVPIKLPPGTYVAKCLLRISNGSSLGFSEMKFRLNPRNP